MAISEDILMCDELVTYLNGATYSLPVAAERVYAADWNLESELADLQLGVWPGESNGEPFERDLLGKSYRIGITFAKKVSAVAIGVLDGLMDLVKEVQEDLELSVISIPAVGSHPARSYVNKGWEYVLRFNDTSLDRHKGADTSIKYTGLFASIIVFDYQSLE